MADPLKLNSRDYRQTGVPPEPVLDVLPKPGDYLGAMMASDAGTLAGPMGSPPPAYPGSAAPGQPWRSVNPAPRKRGALRG